MNFALKPLFFRAMNTSILHRILGIRIRKVFLYVDANKQETEVLILTG